MRWRDYGVTWVFALLCGLAVPAAAQVPGASSTQKPPAAEPVADPLGRDTPSGTILGFNVAVRRNDLVTGALYLQLSPVQRPDAETLARQTNELIDRYFTAPITSLSTSRSGTPNDGLPLDRDRVEMTIDGKPFALTLVRVPDPQAEQIWLISSESLTQVPALYRSAQAPWLERIMPEALVNYRVFGLSLARWLAGAATLVLPFLGLWTLTFGLMTAARKTIADSAPRKYLEAWHSGMRWPAIAFLTLIIHLTLLRYLAFSLRGRYVYSRSALVVLIAVGTWLLLRFLTLSIANVRLVAQRRGDSGFSSLMMLAERVGKVLITLIAIFAILTVAGVDTTTALAGVGIGGVALALGAQKTVENLLGGVFLITDGALAVGDECRIGDRSGRIEDITLRSVRLRTSEQTLLSIPAGALSQANIENFRTRDKILVQTMLRLRYETTAKQLRAVLDGIRRLLAEHPKIERESARIRLVNFGAQAIELELFAYVLTADSLAFLASREELLLKIAGIVEAASTTFARPTEFLYLSRQTADTERTPAEHAS